MTELKSKLETGEILLVDKPLFWTSFDVVKKIKLNFCKKYDLKKIKIGHTGTLDPLATGLLVLCTGKMTKNIEEIQQQDKTYTGIITIGATTQSHDLESEIENKVDFNHIQNEDIKIAINELTGEIMQTPPVYSAVKKNGKRAYEYARKGIKIKLQSRPVIIKKFQVIKIDLPNIKFKINCSKGTYIRSIARDLGDKLNVGAYLSELKRVACGSFNIRDAHSIEKIIELI